MTQLLQPGDVPAWDGTDPAPSIADIFANDTWPAIWERMIHPYANTAARDAGMAGLAPTDRAFALLLDTNSLTMWTGTAWVILSSGWVTFSAPIRHLFTTTPATITSTLIYAKYRWVGPKTVQAKASATIASPSTGGAGLALPFTAAAREFAVLASITGSSAPTTQVNAAFSPDKANVVVSTPTFGYADMASGNRISYDITYEVA